ncbi:MAG: YcjF family protein [Pseudomonadota bacterium]
MMTQQTTTMAEDVAERDVLITQLRQSRAQETVERHATYSAVGGFIPLPLVDIASVIAVNVSMLRSLSEYYDQPFERSRTVALVGAVATSLLASGSGAVTTWALARIVPGANVIGMAAASTMAAILTRRLGGVFIAHFEAGGTIFDFNEDQLREAIDALRAASAQKRGKTAPA